MRAALLAILLTTLLAAQPGPLAPTGLRCEYLAQDVLIDVAQPRFSWVLNHTGRAQVQSAYQVVVSSSADFTSQIAWDSGRVASPQSTHIPYAGEPLQSDHTYDWRVRYWDKDGRESPYSSAAVFETGLLDRSEWKGHFISGGNQLRKEFTLARKPARARAYVVGLGYYELRINGAKVGNRVLDPGWTTFDKRVLYSGYDVTGMLQQGRNAIGLILGQGRFRGRIALVQLNIELESGDRVSVVTDESWSAGQGPIVSESVYNGEVYDARLETPGWDKPGFDEGGWKQASLAEAPKGVLSAEMMPPIRVVETLVPRKLTSPKPGVYIFDMGQNFSGWIELRALGPRGTRVRIRHAELLYPDGTLNVENLRAAKATDTYILAGDGVEEVWQPRFTYHGFRYVEVTGFPGTPKLDSIRGKVVRTDVKPRGGFAASNALLNQIQHNILWGITSNLHSIPTDCNQRDERLGWMADAHLYAEPALLNFDMAAFYTNFLRNIRDDQGANGTVGDVVPAGQWGGHPADPAWGAAYPLITWYVYLYEGDRRILEQHYAGVKAWADFERSQAKENILSLSKYGDWVPIEKTPGDLVSTAYYYTCAKLTSQMAQVLGKAEDADAYKKLADDISAAFNARFWNPALGAYGSGTQTAQILPLAFGMVPDDKRRAAASWLNNDIVYRNNTHLTTGILGAKHVFDVISPDVAFEIATETTYPSWGYMVENGATTLWELWQNKTGPGMNSHNHPMFGSIGGWFYSGLAGIRLDPSAPGYQRVLIQPRVVRDLQWASGSTETLRGTVSSSWRRTEGGLKLEATIPAGSTAEIRIPKLGLDNITVAEGGKPVWKDKTFQPGVEGLTAGRDADGAIILEAGSGTYVFELSGT